MLKRGLIAISFLFLLIFSAGVYAVSADSVDDEFKKLAHYAGEYETGNINYVQFIIYTSSIRGKMNEILGATGKEMGGILKEEQLKAVLGEPTEETKWVWSEGEEKEKKIDSPAPVWRKIVFDGRKIQIRLNAWPSIFSKKQFKEENGNKDEENKNLVLEDLEGKLVYRLNFEIEFKKPEEQLNIQSRIDTISALAQTFNSDPSLGNAETLAKESVNAERTFESYFRQSGGKCEDIMGSIFGTENKRKTQQLYVQEITFCEGENFEVVARLEMCDECEWNWINVDFRVEGRGQGFKPEEGQMNQVSPKSFENLDSAGFEGEVKRIISEMKQSCDNKDFNSIMNAKSKLWPLNDAWNQKSNDVWKELDQTFKSQTESMTPEQRQEFDQNYGWIKQEQEKKQKAKELSKSNYEKRKQFYLTLFSSYDKKESYYTQVEFEKRLIEEFKERGEEICDNNQDDNQNEAVDCADDQCGGKICGKGTSSLQEGNASEEVEVNFYCIEKECKAREEIQQVVRNVSMVCPEIPAIECEQGGKVFFSRYDNETNCPLETICLKETASCAITEDCVQPACGTAECVENKCEITTLTECRELECSEGDEKICELDGTIVEICNNGFWEKIGECGQEPEIREEVVVENQCLTANECGADNVCNNGMCQMLPQAIMVEPVEQSVSEEQKEQISQEEIQTDTSQQSEQTETGQTNEINEQETISQPNQEPEQPQQEQTSSEPAPETQASEPALTGSIIFKSIMGFFSKITMTGFEVDGQTPTETSSTGTSQPSETTTSSEPSQPVEQTTNPEFGMNPEQPPQNNPPFENQEPGQFQDNPNQQPFNEQENRDDEQRRQEDDRRQEEDQERQEENKQRCENDCKRPCIEKCIRKECGQELDCVVEEVQKKCEGSCDAPSDCVEKCTQGGDWWKEFENKEEHKEERGVFQVGGNCRTSQGKTEGSIWFGGWGEPFEQIQFLKNKYYSGGQADWCKDDFENLKKQRQEFEAGFNQEFVVWFFEKHLANSAENWEQSVSGIFELYWKDVDNSREMAYRMQCLGVDELPPVNLVNVKYETDYGKLEFWEEIKTVKLEGMDKEVQVVSPYMKVWVFPNKEFIVYEMKKAMKEHEFPGDQEQKMERKNEEGPTAQEREMIKQDDGFMDKIRQITENYNGNLNAVIRFVDNETVVFNLYAQINENDIMKIQPMLPEEVPKEDVRIDIEFQKIYDIIYTQEKEMSGQRIESPPWDRKVQPIQRINEMVNGVKMYFTARDMLNSAKISPEASEDDVRALMKSFFSMMMKSENNRDNNPEMNQEVQGETDNQNPEEKGIVGNIIFG
jgi:hypothetical protein